MYDNLALITGRSNFRESNQHKRLPQEGHGVLGLDNSFAVSERTILRLLDNPRRDDMIEDFVRMADYSPNDFPGPVNQGNPGEFTIPEPVQKIIAYFNDPLRRS